MRTKECRLAWAVVILAAFFGLGLALTPRAGAYIYWADGNGSNDSHIMRANLNGTNVDQSFITANMPTGVAVDGSHVYWANSYSHTIGRAKLNGTGVDQSLIRVVNVVAPRLDAYPEGVAVDGSHVYWANLSGAIGRANLDGTGVDQSFIRRASRTTTVAVTGVAVDGSHVYWSEEQNNTIGRANLNGTGVQPRFITGASAPYGIAVDGSHVYWANYNGGTIGRANLNGTGVDQRFITGANRAQGVAVDGSHVYWTNVNHLNFAQIGRANLDGTGVDQSFITKVRGPTALTVDSLVGPRNTVLPKISGRPRVGETLSCSTGTWTGTAPITYTRQWLRNGNPIADKTAATYRVHAADAGKKISCRVTAKNKVDKASARSLAVTIRK